MLHKAYICLICFVNSCCYYTLHSSLPTASLSIFYIFLPLLSNTSSHIPPISAVISPFSCSLDSSPLLHSSVVCPHSFVSSRLPTMTLSDFYIILPSTCTASRYLYSGQDIIYHTNLQLHTRMQMSTLRWH